jgi:hypothetical protein
MDWDTQLDNLKEIAKHLEKDPRITGVYLEYPCYLSVVIDEDSENFVYYGYSLDEDEKSKGLVMSWNDITGNIGGEFDTRVRPEANAETLLTQLQENGLFTL